MPSSIQIRPAPALHRINLAVWTLLALAVAGQETALHRLAQSAGPLPAALLLKLAILPCWALATPRVIQSVRRWPLHGPRAWSNALRHAGLAGLFVLASNVVIRVPQFLGPDGFALDGFGRSLVAGLTLYGPLALVVYGTIVSVGEWLVLREVAAKPAPAPEPGAAAAPGVETLALREGERRQLVPVAEIAHIQADDNHVRVFTTGGTVYRVRERLGDIEAVLDPTRFIRIHRSAIVPICRIRAVVQLSHGDWAVDLTPGVRLRVARGRRHRLQQAIAARVAVPAP